VIENDPRYVRIITDSISSWLGKSVKDTLFMNCEEPKPNILP